MQNNRTFKMYYPRGKFIFQQLLVQNRKIFRFFNEKTYFPKKRKNPVIASFAGIW